MGDARETANRHHSYFGKDFQMLLTLKEGHTWPPQHALGLIIYTERNKKLKFCTKKVPAENF